MLIIEEYKTTFDISNKCGLFSYKSWININFWEKGDA
jgi:hypothetical protein